MYESRHEMGRAGSEGLCRGREPEAASMNRICTILLQESSEERWNEGVGVGVGVEELVAAAGMQASAISGSGTRPAVLEIFLPFLLPLLDQTE